VQIELRVLAEENGIVGESVVADALVAERRECVGGWRIRALTSGCGGELAQGGEIRPFAGSKPWWPTP
jgi:hypothetical protein